MSVLKDLKRILQPDDPTPSLVYWNALLTFFEQHDKEEFDVETMRVLCQESERCRAYWNSKRIKRISFMKGMDNQPQCLEVEENGLQIKKSDVYPRIYECLVELESRETTMRLDRQHTNPIQSGQQPICAPA